MTVVEIVDQVTAWAQKEICDKVRLKMPPENDKDSDSAGYEYTTVTPTAFSLFIPSKEKLPPAVLSPIPSLCVRILEGEDSLTDKSGRITLEFCLCTWNPGIHGQDILFPDEKDHSIVHQWKGAEAEAYYQRHYEGWRDAWNWVDVTLRALESHLDINGIEIDQSAGIKFYPMKEQEAIPDFYPFWFACVQFGVRRPLVRNIPSYQHLL